MATRVVKKPKVVTANSAKIQKAVKKAAKKKEPQYNVQTMIGELQKQVWDLHKRIDRIIEAHEQCKKLKGL